MKRCRDCSHYKAGCTNPTICRVHGETPWQPGNYEVYRLTKCTFYMGKDGRV